jgi:hypothetical protein
MLLINDPEMRRETENEPQFNIFFMMVVLLLSLLISYTSA